MDFSNPPGEVSTLTVICTAWGGGGGRDAGGILAVKSNDPAEFFQPDRLDSLRADPVGRHPMLSKGLECVTHSLFQTKSYQLPSRGESVFTKTGGLYKLQYDGTTLVATTGATTAMKDYPTTGVAVNLTILRSATKSDLRTGAPSFLGCWKKRRGVYVQP